MGQEEIEPEDSTYNLGCSKYMPEFSDPHYTITEEKYMEFSKEVDDISKGKGWAALKFYQVTALLEKYYSNMPYPDILRENPPILRRKE